MKKKVLIIGGSRGIGFYLCKQLSELEVHATYRSNYSKYDNIIWHKLDLGYCDQFDDFVNKLSKNKHKFNYVLFVAAHTPALIGEEGVTFQQKLNADSFSKYFLINAIAPSILFEKIYINKLLSKNAVIVFFSSQAGSISLRGKLSHNLPGGNMVYRASKAALNSCVKNISYDTNPEELTIIALHPGWVQTDSGGIDADIDMENASIQIKNRIYNLSSKDHGKFLTLNNQELEW
ncbi:SDR family NAD(P)-dependent oxidoreductase [Alphaproteobacteria bacterium]|nr:SDR family NAD(P)-dependent oxidoreductase [Alphaproteobacteria bacterium]